MSREAVIFDVDGTLVDVTSIRHHVVPSAPGWRGFKDFEAFHRASVWCPPIQATVDAAHRERAAGRGILVMTARKQRWRPHTVGWLDGLIEWDELYMRGDQDNRPDTEVKRDLLALARSRGWDVVHAWDDNPAIIALWQAEGIPVTVIPGWY